MSDLSEGMSLTDKEAKALARLLIADQAGAGRLIYKAWLGWRHLNVPDHVHRPRPRRTTR